MDHHDKKVFFPSPIKTKMSITLQASSDQKLILSNTSAGILKSNSSGTVSSHSQISISDISGLQAELDTLSASSSSSSSSSFSIDSVVGPIAVMDASAQPNFGKQWEELNSDTPNIIDIACSGDGRVILVCPWVRGSPTWSSDFGVTWSMPTGLSSMMWSAAASFDGKYVVAIDNSQFKVSSNYGASFVSLPNNFPRPGSVQSVALSATAKYMMAACSNGNGLQVSSDFGSTWVRRETSTWTWSSITSAVDASVIYASSDTGLIKKSIDFGQTWTTVYTDASARAIKSITCSQDGQFVLVAFQSSATLLHSSNFGVSFTSKGSSASYYKVDMSASGQYMIASISGSPLRVSSDYGQTWTTSTTSNRFAAVAMSLSGDLIYNASPDQKVTVSRRDVLILPLAAPVIPTTGSQYFDTATNKLFVYNGSVWKSVSLL